MAWLPRQYQNGHLQSQSFKMNFFRIVGTSKAETSVNGKAECFLVIGGDYNSKLSGVTSFKECHGGLMECLNWLKIDGYGRVRCLTHFTRTAGINGHNP